MKKQTVAYVFGCIVNILLNIALIPKLNQNGAAIASVISEFVLNTILFIQLKRISGISVEWKYLMGILQSCAIMTILVVMILKYLPNGIAELMAISFGGLIYAISGYFLGNELVQTIVDQVKTVVKKRKQ